MNSTHAPRFSSNIRFVSEEDFRDVSKGSIPSADSPYRYQDRAQLAEESKTEGIYDCNAGGIRNNNRHTMFHVSPYTVNFDNLPTDRFEKIGLPVPDSTEEVTETFYQDIEHLRSESSRNLRGFLTGGQNHVLPSRMLRDMFLDACKKQNLPVSLIWGQQRNTPGTSVHYSNATDTWTVFSPDISSLSDLKEQYEIINIADGDRLFIGSREIASEDARQDGRPEKDNGEKPRRNDPALILKILAGEA